MGCIKTPKHTQAGSFVSLTQICICPRFVREHARALNWGILGPNLTPSRPRIEYTRVVSLYLSVSARARVNINVHGNLENIPTVSAGLDDQHISKDDGIGQNTARKLDAYYLPRIFKQQQVRLNYWQTASLPRCILVYIPVLLREYSKGWISRPGILDFKQTVIEGALSVTDIAVCQPPWVIYSSQNFLMDCNMLDPCTFLLLTQSTWMRPACNVATATAAPLRFLALAVYLSKDQIQATKSRLDSWLQSST